MLMCGYTSERDVGSPTFGLKKAIDLDMVAGPRIWPSRGNDLAVRATATSDVPPIFLQRQKVSPTASGAMEIADDADTVRRPVREQSALGASQIKLMAAGGVSSNYDPLGVMQYKLEELRAAVKAAENWGTYVTVHVYTPRSVRQAIEAGVRCIDHGQLLDDATAKLMAEKGIWWSLQPLTDDRPSRFPEGSLNRTEQLAVYVGTETAFKPGCSAATRFDRCGGRPDWRSGRLGLRRLLLQLARSVLCGS